MGDEVCRTGGRRARSRREGTMWEVIAIPGLLTRRSLSHAARRQRWKAQTPALSTFPRTLLLSSLQNQNRAAQHPRLAHRFLEGSQNLSGFAFPSVRPLTL